MMDLTKLMATLKQRGVRLNVTEDGKMTATAPPGVLTPELTSELQMHRHEIADMYGVKPYYPPAPDFGPRPASAAVPARQATKNQASG